MLTESGFFQEEATSERAPCSSRSSVPPDLAPGRRIASGKYELFRKIGVGAMGEVWAAKHLSLDDEVAIKLVLRDVQHEDGSTADGRFLVEARVARLLSRKTRHVVSVTDHGADGDMAYLVMELLSGEALDARLARAGPLPIEKVVPLIKQVARALSVAHAEGIVHRDLKPGNVFLTLDEEGNPLIKILDFGIAKLTSDPPDREGGEARTPVGVSVHEAKQKTLRGFLLGTPAYMSPEQARGRNVDHRADVWALAVITYHLLTAQFPFDGKDAEELFRRLVRVQAYPITDHRTDLPPAMSDLFAKAFARRIDDRFASAEEFAIALDDAAGNRTPVKLSLPPSALRKPAPLESSLPPSALRKPAPLESSLIAAGVPRGGRRVSVIAGAVVLATFGALAVGYDRFMRPEPPASGLSAGALATGTPPVPRDDRIPPPEPVAPVPEVKEVREAPRAPVVTPPVVAPPPSVVVVVPEAPQPLAKKPVDKSEVF